jgi:hypothetical protein
MATDDYTCEITTRLSEPSNNAFVPFENTPVLQFVHDRSPRFGKSNDILLFLVGTEEEQQDYVRGLLASSIAIVVLVLCWTGFLIYAKYKGPEKFGWLSGRRSRKERIQNTKAAATTSEDVEGAENGGLEVLKDQDGNKDDDDEANNDEIKVVDDTTPEEAAKEQAVSSPDDSKDGDANSNNENGDDEIDKKESSSSPGETITNSEVVEEEEEDVLTEEEYVRLVKQQRILKFVVCFSSVGIIISSFLLAFKGYVVSHCIVLYCIVLF